MVRITSTAAASLAAILACRRLGIAMAAMIKIMATTIRSSSREKPRRRCKCCCSLPDCVRTRMTRSVEAPLELLQLPAEKRKRGGRRGPPPPPTTPPLLEWRERFASCVRRRSTCARNIETNHTRLVRAEHALTGLSDNLRFRIDHERRHDTADRSAASVHDRVAALVTCRDNRIN